MPDRLGGGSRRRPLANSAFLAAGLIVGALLFSTFQPAPAQASGGGSCGYINDKGNPLLTDQDVQVVKCYMGEAEKAIENDQVEIVSGAGDCEEQQIAAHPFWLPVEKTGENLLDAVQTNISGQQDVVGYLVDTLQRLQGNYARRDQKLLSLRSGIRDLDPHFSNDLRNATNEATLAGTELIAHACSSAKEHSLNDVLKNMDQNSSDAVMHLQAAIQNKK
jgi:hypothetical protein